MDLRIIGCSLALAALTSTAIAQPAAQTIPLDLSGTRPAVSVSINGAAPELWVFDTGAMGAIINIDHAHALNLPEQQPVQIGSPAGGTPMQGFLTQLSNATIGGVAMAPFHIVAVPTILPDRGGVIGPNVFAGKLLTLDLAHSQLRIAEKTPANTPQGEGAAYAGNGPHKLPAIPVTLNGQTTWAHIDTGAPGALVLPYSMASSLPLAAPPVEVGHARFVDGVHTRYSATLNGDVQVGPLTLHNPEIGFIDGLPNLNVGMELLTRLTITLDPEQQRSWVTVNPATPSAH